MTASSSAQGSMLLHFLENSFHPWMNSTLSIDMDQVQAQNVAMLPPFTLQNALIFTGVVTFFWAVLFFFLHTAVIKPLLMIFGAQNVLKLSWQKQCYYTSYYHSVVHALISGLLGVYCLAYADGKPGTTWFDNSDYQLTMFDTQKYAQLISIAYISYDLIFCIVCAEENEAGMAVTYAHHFFTLGGSAITCYIGGLFGSICQLTWITEASTPFVNLRIVLSHHKLDDTTLYLLNGLSMTVVFFWMRVVFYSYMLWVKCIEHGVWNFGGDFWTGHYGGHKQPFAIFSFILYNGMYAINLFWFSKMIKGLLKVAGILGSSKKRVEQKQD